MHNSHTNESGYEGCVMDIIKKRNRLPSTGHLKKISATSWRLQWKVKAKPYCKTIHASSKTEADNMAKKEIILVRASIIEGTFHKLYDKEDNVSDLQGKRFIALDDLWNIYVKSVNRPQSSPQTLRQYRLQINIFVKWVRKKYPAIDKVNDIDRTIARAFALNVQQDKKANTFNKYINILSLVFRTVIDEAEIDLSNPWDGIKKMRIKGNTNSKMNFSEEQRQIILKTAKDEMLALFLIGDNTPLRLGDCCLLKWSDIDLNDGYISCTPNKTMNTSGINVNIPIFNSEFLDYLKKQHKQSNSEYVCPEFASHYLKGHGSPTTGNSEVSRRIQKFLKDDCGIRIHKEGTGAGTGKQAVVQYGFHSMRHSFIARAESMGVDELTIKALAGWSSNAVRQVYCHLSAEHISAQLEKMNQH